jgi:ribosomal protein L23
MNTLLGVVGTNKSYRLGDLDRSQVVFKVSGGSNKTIVKKAVMSLFDVSVVSVNILNCKGKSRKFGKTTGKTKSYKKAVVTLKEGDEIDFGSKVSSKKKDKAKKDKPKKEVVDKSANHSIETKSSGSKKIVEKSDVKTDKKAKDSGDK